MATCPLARHQTYSRCSVPILPEKWCLDVDGSRIEIALDLGDVKAGEFAEPICELELELLRGDTRAVLKLAKQLLSQTGLRQGSLSKAARGYHGAGNAPRENTPTAILRTAAKATVEQGLEASLDLALSQWQYHEELWLRGDESAKEHVLDAMGLVRHALMLLVALFRVKRALTYVIYLPGRKRR